jgi:hypothetical protein
MHYNCIFAKADQGKKKRICRRHRGVHREPVDRFEKAEIQDHVGHWGMHPVLSTFRSVDASQSRLRVGFMSTASGDVMVAI